MEVEWEEENEKATIFPIAEYASIQPCPPLTGGHIPFSELGIYPADGGMVMDISNLNFDQLKNIIVQESGIIFIMNWFVMFKFIQRG